MSLASIVPALLGGALIGLAATLLLVFNGRIAGISGIVSGLFRPASDETGWRAAFVVGLIAGGVVLALVRPSAIGATDAPLGLVVVAGLLVGIGAQLGNGCTSGHGVCGISRFSPRSIAATLTFMSTGALATFVLHHVIGGAR